MGHEIELKLEIPRQQARQLAGSAWLKKLACGPVQKKHLVSVYYDTDDLTLRDNQSMLRVRRVDGRFVQTFKAQAMGTGALSRLQWEVPIQGPKPDLRRAHKRDTGGLNLKKLRKSLKPIFETTVSRTIVPVRYRGSLLELAIDQGQVKTGRLRLPIHEIEVELKKGRPQAVIALGKKLASKLQAAFGVLSKAERGYALRRSKVNQSVCATPVVLSPNMMAAEAFEAIAMSCLHHFAANRRAVMAERSEGVHQMRVGLRRLRAAISLFEDVLGGPETERIKTDLKWLTEELGPARDMDVLMEETIDPLVESTPQPRSANALKNDIESKRDKDFTRALVAVQSDRYRHLVLQTALWIMGGRWRKYGADLVVARRKMSVQQFATQELGRRAAKIVKKLDKIEDLSSKQQHKLRIAVKKLRYAVEYFESLYNGKQITRRRKGFAEILKALQSSLGKLNDIRVHWALARKYADEKRRRRNAVPKAFAMGLLSGQERTRVSGLLKAAKRDGKCLSRHAPFWE